MGRVFNRESPKKSQLHNLRLPGIQYRQPVQRMIQHHHVDFLTFWQSGSLVEGESQGVSFALGCIPRPCVIHENLSHKLRGQPEKLRSILPMHRTAIDKAKIRLVD